MARRYFLRCVILSDILFFSLVAGQSPRYELRGQKVSLKPDIPGRPENILWKRNGNKVVEFNGQEQEAYGQYENRVSLDWHSAELNITELRFEDSGDYELEVYMNKKLSISLHKLEVIDRVAKPNISCEMNDGSGSNKSGTLLCSAEPRQPRSLMKFEWRSRGKVQPGTNLTISLGDEYDDEEYSCRVQNPLSEETTSFIAKHCYPENNSVLIGVLVGIAVLSLFVMGLGIFCCKQHNKVCFAKGNRQEGSDEGRPEECKVLIDRTPTMPSTQRLFQGSVRNKVELFESSFHGESLPISFPAGLQRNKDKKKRPPLDLNHLANNNKGDADEEKLRESAKTEVPQCENTPEPAAELTDTMSSTAAEQSVLEKNKDENEETGPPPSTPHSESQSPLDPSNAASNDNGDADAERLSELAEKVLQHHDSSDSEKENELKPADVSTNTMSPLELSSASEHQEHDGDSQDETPKKVFPGRVRNTIKLFEPSFRGESPFISFPAGLERNKDKKKRPPLDLNHLANNNKGDADEEKLRESAKTEVPQCENTPEPAAELTDTMSSTAAEQSAEDDEEWSLLDTTVTPPTPQSPVHVGDSDTVKGLEKNKDENEGTGSERKPADVSANTMSDVESSTASEHQDSEKDEEGKSPPADVVTPVPKPRSQLPQNSPNIAPEGITGGQKEDANSNQVNGETDTSGVGEANESGASGEDENLGSEGNSEEPDLYSASSHQPQSSTPTKPDNRSSDNFQESPDAAHEEPGQQGEGETTKESEESGESKDDNVQDKK
ncbi:dentin sialophosphoprotein-like isoform X3 [Acanthopagrus latus]|uniref:dentin sialophosphoprotein-like isoform X3 n=1 Tax=Acanthopagrus latus TaxID=8177 RepID=UPI00187C2983|nr:dentin sialophosphoprotein-like isoform X3 [Acanthopagrus latus]